jgi:hypothetical protein
MGMVTSLNALLCIGIHEHESLLISKNLLTVRPKRTILYLESNPNPNPERDKTMEITLSKESVDAIVAEIKSIDEKLVKVAGTASERRNKAEQALRAHEAQTSDLNSDQIAPFEAVDLLTTQLAELTDKLADAKNDAREAVDAYLKAQKDETSAEATALKATRDQLANKVNALATLLELTVDVPKAPKGSPSHNGSGTRTKTSKGVWSYKREGSSEWTVPNDHQQSLSSIAFRVFDKAPTPQVREALEQAGVTSFTQDFESTVTVNGKTATIRFNVVSNETVTPTS